MAASGGRGGESPDSASLYSDEIPSGYNSGEQYDTISTGYMSGEAYELPEARLDIRGPSLDDVVEEDHVAASADDEDVFMVPPPPPVTASSAITGVDDRDDDDGSTTTSSGQNNVDNDGVEMAADGSKVKLLRKKVTTFAVPIMEARHLAASDQYDESSDAIPSVVGYRAVPSDTDTSALDSDANAMLPNRKTRRVRKRMDEEEEEEEAVVHDNVWFQLHDNVWWTATRSVCFWGSVVAMVAATLVACLMVAAMPRNCDPDLSWYRGTVAVDVISPEVDELTTYRSLGIQTLHLRQPTIDDDDDGGGSALRNLTDALHRLNMTLMVQLPVADVNNGSMTLAVQQRVANAVKHFAERGADGVFLDGLERFGGDRWIADAVSSWRNVIDRYGTTDTSRILMAPLEFARSLHVNGNERGKVALRSIDLLDATLDLDVNFTAVSNAVERIAAAAAVSGGDGLWINWNLKTSADDPPTNAALSLQMLCPGSVNVNAAMPTDEENLKRLIELRTASVPIRMNGDNYFLRQPLKDVIQMERFYTRRHRYVLVANFGDRDDADLAAVGRIYSGGELVLDTGGRFPHLLNTHVAFKSLSLSPGQAVVVKLPK